MIENPRSKLDGCLPKFLRPRQEKPQFPERLALPELSKNLHLMREATHQFLVNGSYGSQYDSWGTWISFGAGRRYEPKPVPLGILLGYDREVRDISQVMTMALADCDGAPIYTERQGVQNHSDAALVAGEMDGQYLHYSPGETLRQVVKGFSQEGEYGSGMWLYFQRKLQNDLIYGTRFSFFIRKYGGSYSDISLGENSASLLHAYNWDRSGLLNFIALPAEAGFSDAALMTTLELDPEYVDTTDMFAVKEKQSGRFRTAEVTVNHEAVKREFEVQIAVDLGSGMSASPFEMVSRLYDERKTNVEKLLFVDLGTVLIEEQELSVWTQAMKPLVSEHDYETTAQTSRAGGFLGAPQPGRA